MLRLLRFLFIGTWKLKGEHEHKWIIHQEGTVSQYGRVIGRRYTMRCETCGDMQTHDAI